MVQCVLHHLLGIKLHSIKLKQNSSSVSKDIHTASSFKDLDFETLKVFYIF